MTTRRFRPVQCGNRRDFRGIGTGSTDPRGRTALASPLFGHTARGCQQRDPDALEPRPAPEPPTIRHLVSDAVAGRPRHDPILSVNGDAMKAGTTGAGTAVRSAR